MPSFPDSRSVRPHIVVGALVGAFILTAYGSYSLGVRHAYGRLSAPPETVRNAGSSGIPGLAIADEQRTVEFGDFWIAWHLLEKNFVPATSSPVASTSEMRVVGAIDGLARSYDDPYTVFIPKKQADAFKEHVNGEFEGIGAVLANEAGSIVVTGILPGSPAESAGLEKGARIVAVDAAPTAGAALADVIPRIRGPQGSTVVLSVIAASSTEAREVTITRGRIAIPTTATRVVAAAKGVVAAAIERARENAAGLTGAAASAIDAIIREKEAEAAKQEFFVLQLTGFARSSVDAFIADFKRFAESETPYLIIDLRNNPGGYLEVAVDLASYFLPEGTLVVTDRSGARAEEKQYRSAGHHALDAIASRRIVVLLNRNSASASEILAGALQDHGLAKVVGERSFGKGSVQTLVDIGELGSLKVTISRWFTPEGRNISESGIVPDITVDLSNPKYASSTDPFMDAAMETLLDDAQWK